MVNAQKQIGIARLFNLQKGTIAWDFVNKSDIIQTKNGIIPKRNDLPNYAGIYGIAAFSTGFLYIGLSRGKIRDRMGGRLDLKERVLRFSEQHNTEIFFYSMGFSDKSPIGSVFADGFESSVNYHESRLIESFRPIFNLRYPSNYFGFNEERYYRELIVDQDSTMGFSSYLIKDLRVKTVLSPDFYKAKDLIKKSNQIIDKDTVSNTVPLNISKLFLTTQQPTHTIEDVDESHP